MPTPNMRLFRSSDRYVRLTPIVAASGKDRSVSRSVNCPVNTLTGSPQSEDDGSPTPALPLPPSPSPPSPPSPSPPGPTQPQPPGPPSPAGANPLPLNMAPVNSVMTTPGS